MKVNLTDQHNEELSIRCQKVLGLAFSVHIKSS